MKKLSSYQKLKQQVEQLKKEKRILVLEPDSMEAIQIRAVVVTGSELDNAILQGSRFGKGNGILDGINNQLKKEQFSSSQEEGTNEVGEVVKYLQKHLRWEKLKLKPEPIKTGKMLIDIFNKEISKLKTPENYKFTELLGLPVEEVSYYPANFFSIGNKCYWIEKNKIIMQEIPSLEELKKKDIVFIREPQTTKTPFGNITFDPGFYPVAKPNFNKNRP